MGCLKNKPLSEKGSSVLSPYSNLYLEKLSRIESKLPLAEPLIDSLTIRDNNQSVSVLWAAAEHGVDFWRAGICDLNGQNCFERDSAIGRFSLHKLANGPYKATVSSCRRSRLNFNDINCGLPGQHTFLVQNNIDNRLSDFLDHKLATEEEYRAIAMATHSAFHGFLLTDDNPSNEKLRTYGYNFMSMGPDFWVYVLSQTDYLTSLLMYTGRSDVQDIVANKNGLHLAGLENESEMEDEKKEENQNGLQQTDGKSFASRVEKVILDSSGSILLSLGSPIFIGGVGMFVLGKTLSTQAKVIDQQGKDLIKDLDKYATDYLGNIKTKYNKIMWDKWEEATKKVLEEIKAEKFYGDGEGQIKLKEITQLRQSMELIAARRKSWILGSEIPEEARKLRRELDTKITNWQIDLRQKHINSYNELLSKQRPLLQAITFLDDTMLTIDKLKRKEIPRSDLEIQLSKLAGINIKPTSKLASPIDDLDDLYSQLKEFKNVKFKDLTNVGSELNVLALKINAMDVRLKLLTKLSYSPTDIGKLGSVIDDNTKWIFTNMKFLLGETLITDLVDSIDDRLRILTSETTNIIRNNQNAPRGIGVVNYFLALDENVKDLAKIVDTEQFILRAEVRDKLSHNIDELEDILKVTINRLTLEVHHELEAKTENIKSYQKKSTEILSDTASNIKRNGLYVMGLGALLAATGLAQSISSEYTLVDQDSNAVNLIKTLQQLDKKLLSLQKEQLAHEFPCIATSSDSSASCLLKK